MVSCVYGHMKEHMMRVKVQTFFSPDQRETMMRLLQGEDMTLMELRRHFSSRKIKELEEAGLWIRISPTPSREPYRVRKEHPAMEA